MRALRAVFALVAAVMIVSGCAGGGTAGDASSAPQGDSASDPSEGASGTSEAFPSTPPGVFSSIVTANGSSIDVWDEPAGEVVATINAADVLTVPDETPLVFLVESRRADWFHVYLPVRPNGSTGWVRVSEVTEFGTDFTLDVYLADHELVLSQGGEELERFPVGVGASDMPTPGGVYFIRELLVPPDPADIYGPYAYGLSGYSPVLDSFRGGDAVIGLHGTNEPDSVGRDVSHGCLRLSNDDITALVEAYGLPLGTPVRIHD